jgi:hypothetical protein
MKMRKRTSLLIAAVFSTGLLLACTKNGSSSPDTPNVNKSETDESCATLGAGTATGLTAENSTGLLGFWEFADLPAADVAKGSKVNYLHYYVVTPAGEFKLFTTSTTQEESGKRAAKVDCLAIVTLGVLESSTGSSSKVRLSVQMIANAKKNGATDEQIEKVNRDGLYNLALGSQDRMTLTGPDGRIVKMRRAATASAIKEIDQIISVNGKIQEVRAAFLSKWQGKTFKLIKTTYIQKDVDGRIIKSNDTVASTQPDSYTSDFPVKGQVILIPKRLMFRSITEAVINGSNTLPVQTTIDPSGKLNVEVLQPEDKTTSVILIRGAVIEQENGLMFDADVISYGPGGSQSRSEEIRYYSL